MYPSFYKNIKFYLHKSCNNIKIFETKLPVNYNYWFSTLTVRCCTIQVNPSYLDEYNEHINYNYMQSVNPKQFYTTHMHMHIITA